MEGFNCTHFALVRDIPYQLWESITTSGVGNTPVWLTRLFYNKPLFYLLNYAKCYFHYLSPLFLSQNITPIGTILGILIIYYLWKKQSVYWKVIKWIIVAYPIIFLFEIQNKLF